MNLLRAFWVYDIRPFLRVFQFAIRGFRAPRGAGWSYDRGGVKSVMLVALAVATIPQALAFDLLFSHAQAVRVISGVVHGYAIVWSLALAQALQTEPHVIAGRWATFRFPLLQSIDVPLADIESVEVVRGAPRDVPRFGLGKVGLVIRLKAAVRIDRPLRARSTSAIFVAADDLRGMQRALAAGAE